MEAPRLSALLPAWRLYEALARRTTPPVSLPPKEELWALETAHLEAPFPHFLQALRTWALGRGLGEPPLVEVRAMENEVVELAAPSFRPYPFTTAFRGEKPLYFRLRGRTTRHSLWLSKRGIFFGRRKGIPVPFLSRVDELYAPVVLPLFGLDLPAGFLGEALRQRVGLDWGRGVLRQGKRYLHADLEGTRLLFWDADSGTYQEEVHPSKEALSRALHTLVLEGGPLYTSLPTGPLAEALRRGDEDALLALRTFSCLLAQGYAQALRALPEAVSSLPRFLPDGRRVKATSAGLQAGRQRVPPLPSAHPPEDPLLAMRRFWDLLALDLSAGVADLLPLAPLPLATPKGLLAFTPEWAASLN